MKKNLNKGCRAQGVRQLEVMLIDLHIRQLQAVINQLRAQRRDLIDAHRKKRRRSLWNEQTPLWDLIYLELSYKRVVKSKSAVESRFIQLTLSPETNY